MMTDSLTLLAPLLMIVGVLPLCVIRLGRPAALTVPIASRPARGTASRLDLAA